MTQALDLDIGPIAVTSGDIAAINLQSARERSWERFWRAPEQTGIAELIVEQEQLTAQFIGDLAAFDRLEMLVNELAQVEPESARTALIAAQVACSTHRFAYARASLSEAVARGAPSDATKRLLLSIDQATGENLFTVLAARWERAAQPKGWNELVPLGALLADLGEFGEAERTYLRALQEYPDVSPFAPAWVCFQLGVLWGECVPEAEPQRAVHWYRNAIQYLPCYVKARVHLAEIYLDQGEIAEARTLLTPALASGDPEVSWRLADVAQAEGNSAEVATQLQAARSGFDTLLARHLLAFADHGAEFYAASGADAQRAFDLAQLNLANRATLRAFEQAHSTARAAGEAGSAARLLADASERWGDTAAFRVSTLATHVVLPDARGAVANFSLGDAQSREQAHAGT